MIDRHFAKIKQKSGKKGSLRNARNLLYATGNSVSLTVNAGTPLFVERGVDGIEIFRVQMILRNTDRVGEALIVNDLSGAEKFDRLPHIGIIGQP